jgi:hypothetical protein
MESSAIATQSDIYSPGINSEGIYVDKIPPQHAFSASGLRCPCSTRKDKVFWTRQNFAIHIRSKRHQTWLGELSLENENLYVKSQEMEKTIKEQKILIARLEREITHRDITILTLTRQFNNGLLTQQLEGTASASTENEYEVNEK